MAHVFICWFRCFCIAFFSFLLMQSNPVKAEENKNNIEQSEIVKFLKKYVSPDKNADFGDKTHLIGLSFGYDFNDTTGSKYIEGEKYSFGSKHKPKFDITLSYYKPFSLFDLNGRYGAFIDYIHDQNSPSDKLKYNERSRNLFRFGFTYEFVIGTEMLYLTAGGGISYSPLRTNTGSCFNWVLLASIGHRFENHFAVEIGWRHYSNGELKSPNFGDNFIMIGIRKSF